MFLFRCFDHTGGVTGAALKPEILRAPVMKRLMLTATLLVYGPMTMAQPLRQTTSLRCRDAAALVTSSGAVVLGTSTHTYKRFVAGAGCGKASEEPAWVAASDTAQCFIGYRCVNRSN